MIKNMQWFVRKTIEHYVNENVHAIDMTMGNGHDTVTLAKRAQKVSAFDLQEAALQATTEKLKQHNLSNVTLYQVSHEMLLDYVKEPYHFVIFNCGYLPGSDKHIITKASTTVRAIERAYEGLAPKGAMVMTLYAKHEGAAEEIKAVHNVLLTLENARVSRYHFLTECEAPEVFLIEKKSLKK